MRLLKWEWRTCRSGLEWPPRFPRWLAGLERFIQDIVSAQSNLKT
jgi:hypothetical protein